MSDEYKVIEVKNYLHRYFQDCEIKVRPNTSPPVFDLIRGYDLMASIEFSRMVWDDNDYKKIAGHLSKVKLDEEINNNVGKRLLVKADKVVPVKQKK